MFLQCGPIWMGISGEEGGIGGVGQWPFHPVPPAPGHLLPPAMFLWVQFAVLNALQ